MVLFQVAGCYDLGGLGKPDMYSFGIFKTKENAIYRLNEVCTEPRRKGYNWEVRYCTHGSNGWLVWINEIADIGKNTKNSLRPETNTSYPPNY